MNAEGMAAWYYQGDGLKLWEETYAPFNLVPRPGPGLAPQMAGWFRKKINTVGDYKGLKMRIPGLGGKVLARAGATTVLTPGGRDLCRARAGRHRRLRVGRAARRHEAGPAQHRALLLLPGLARAGHHAEFGFNRKAYEALPADLRRTLDHAAAAVQVYGLADYHAKNAIALERLRTEFKGKVEVLQFPVPVLRDLKKLAAEVVREESEKTPDGPEGSRVVHEVPAAAWAPGTTSPRAPTTSSSRCEEG